MSRGCREAEMRRKYEITNNKRRRWQRGGGLAWRGGVWWSRGREGLSRDGELKEEEEEEVVKITEA